MGLSIPLGVTLSRLIAIITQTAMHAPRQQMISKGILIHTTHTNHHFV